MAGCWQRRAEAGMLHTPLAAAKDALSTGLVTFGLSFPIIAYRTEQDISNRLVLEPRWALACAFAGLAFVLRLLWLMGRSRRERRAPPVRRASSIRR